MRTLWTSFSLAWNFLAIIPLPCSRQSQVPPQMLARSFGWYPIVGFLLGAMLLLSDRALMTVLAEPVVNVLLIILLILITGALHQDGFVDTIDGIAGGKDAAHRLMIMRDSHIGAIGATGLILALGLRYAGLVNLPPGSREWILLSFPALGRWAMVVAAWKVSYARPEGGVAKAFIEYISMRDVIIATTILGMGMFWSLHPVYVIVLMLSIVAIVRLVVWGAARLFGGVTGDILGAINEIIEIGVLVLAPFLVRNVQIG